MAVRRTSDRRNSSLPKQKPLTRLERLEDRTTPAALVVTTGNDVVNANDGLLSLREAVTTANANNQADTITFAAGVTTVSLIAGTISLTEAGQGNATTIDGGATGVTVERSVDAPEFFAVYTVAADAKGVLRNQTITGGAGATGGGIQNNGAIEVIGCTLTNNGATTSGGAIWTSGLFPSYIINSTISGNTSSGAGGGIWHGTGDLFITNSTIAKNITDPFQFNQVAPLGGGIHTTGQATVSVNNTIFADNLSVTTPNDISGVMGAASFNNIVTHAGSAGGMTILNNNKVGAASATFLNATLTKTTGPTATHAIVAGSIAVNGGDTTLAVDADNVALTTDQRGQPRVAGAAVDIGAVELPVGAPPPAGGPVALYAVGSGPGGAPTVRVFNLDGTQKFSFPAYDGKISAGVSVATADVNGDGTEDIITGTGPLAGPHVKVFSGVNGAELFSFFAYDKAFAGGVNVSAGDVNGDGKADIITGPASSGGPHVKVFSGADMSELRSFFAYDAKITAGVTVAAADIDGDGRKDVITGTGNGAGPHVKVFGAAGELRSFFAYDGKFTGGVSVAGGDINGDGREDIVTGAGPGGLPQVRVFSGIDNTALNTFNAFAPAVVSGVRVAIDDVNGDQLKDIIVGVGRGGGSVVKRFNGADMAELSNFTAFATGFTGGVYVG